jgi:hypothetical protein
VPVFRLSALKSERLKKVRSVSFEELIREGFEIKTIASPVRVNQKVILFYYRQYVWAIPYVENETEIFFKTLYPSRKYTKMLQEGRL